MNISDCAANLLTYFSPEEREVPDNATYPGRNAAVLKAMNEGLQDLFGKGKPWVRKDERGVVLNAPASVPITVTKGSKLGSIAASDWQDWFLGCTIAIDGSEVDNQIRNFQIVGNPNIINVSGDLLNVLGNAIPPTDFILTANPEFERPYYMAGDAGGIYWDGFSWFIAFTAGGEWTSSEDVATPDLVAEWTATVGEGTPIVQFTTNHLVTLKFPYGGDDGAKDATVYHNSVTVDTDVLEVIEPVKCDRSQLVPVNNPSPNRFRRFLEDYGRLGQIDINSLQDRRVGDTAGRPLAFSVVTWSRSDADAPEIRIHLLPAPAQEGYLEYSAMLCPPALTSIQSTASLPIPFAFIESIFLPIALKKLRSSPFWRGLVGEDEVSTGYTNALALLEEGNPQRRSGIRFQSKF